MRVRLPSNYWKYRDGRGATRHMVLVHLPTGTGENGLKVTIDNNNHTISLHYPLAQIMLDPQALFTGAAFEKGYYVADDASRPALDAIQSRVDDLLYMDDEVTCETTISVDQVELSFTDKEICHLDDRITVIQLEPEDASLSGKQKIMLTKVYGLIDMTERNTSEGYSKTKKTAMVDMWA